MTTWLDFEKPVKELEQRIQDLKAQARESGIPAQGEIEDAGDLLVCERLALAEEELLERIRDVHVLGIRSKTRVTAHALGEARRLLAEAPARALRTCEATRRPRYNTSTTVAVRRTR